MTTQAHLVVPDLFLPPQIADQACAGLQLSALEEILSRSTPETLPQATLEDWLCAAFGAAAQAVAPVTLQADGVAPGGYYWLRADPVHLRIAQDQMVLQPAQPVTDEEATQLCEALNRHFAEDGLHFVAPVATRWYLRLEQDPQLVTTTLAEAIGRSVHPLLPQGESGLRWHSVLNEIQMLLFAHPLNEVREQRGECAINGVWLWGGGYGIAELNRPAGRMGGDSMLARAFAAVAGVETVSDISACLAAGEGTALLVYEGMRQALQQGDLDAWREALQHFAREYAQPMLQALRAGRIEKIVVDVPSGETPRRFVLTRADLWKFWRRVRPLPRLA